MVELFPPNIRGRFFGVLSLIAGKRLEYKQLIGYRLRIYTGTTKAGKRTYFFQTFRGTAGQASLRLQELALSIDKDIMPTRIVPEPEPVIAEADVQDCYNSLSERGIFGKTIRKPS